MSNVLRQLVNCITYQGHGDVPWLGLHDFLACATTNLIRWNYLLQIHYVAFSLCVCVYWARSSVPGRSRLDSLHILRLIGSISLLYLLFSFYSALFCSPVFVFERHTTLPRWRARGGSQFAPFPLLFSLRLIPWFKNPVVLPHFYTSARISTTTQCL